MGHIPTAYWCHLLGGLAITQQQKRRAGNLMYVCVCVLEIVNVLTQLQQNKFIPTAIFHSNYTSFFLFSSIDSVHFHFMVGAEKFPT